MILFGLVKIKSLSSRQPFCPVWKRLGTAVLTAVAEGVYPPWCFLVNFSLLSPKTCSSPVFLTPWIIIKVLTDIFLGAEERNCQCSFQTCPGTGIHWLLNNGFPPHQGVLEFCLFNLRWEENFQVDGLYDDEKEMFLRETPWWYFKWYERHFNWAIFQNFLLEKVAKVRKVNMSVSLEQSETVLGWLWVAV